MSVSVPDLVVAVASDADAPAMVEVIHAAFGARPPLDPPSTAMEETTATVTSSLGEGGGIYATVAGRPAGVVLVQPGEDGHASFQRVSVHPEFQRHGIASAMVTAAEELAATLGYERVELFARQEFAQLIAFWRHRGFVIDRSAPYGVVLVRDLPLAIRVSSAAAMRALGRRLASMLRPGDLIIAAGDLGAGKTTLTQGIGEALQAAGPIISPTFVLSRVHRSSGGGPALVHVDAYRLSTPGELDDLDLEATVPTSVTVVEWGQGIAEGLAESRLEVDLWTPVAGRGVLDGDHERIVTLQGIGPRWDDVDLRPLRAAVTGDDLERQDDDH